MQRRANLIEREVRTRAVGRAEKDEVVALPVVATDIAEGCLPERRLTLQMIRIISEAWRIPADALIGHYELDGETDPSKAEAHPRTHRARGKQVA